MSARGEAARARAIELAIETVHRPERWPSLCDAVCDALGGTAFMVFEWDLSSFGGPVFYGSRAVEKALPLVAATMQGDLPAVELEGYARFARFPAGQLVGEYECFDLDHDRDLPPNPYREAVLAASGAGSRSVMRLNDIGPWSDLAALHLGAPAAEALPRLRAEAGALLSVLGRAIEAGRTLRGLHRVAGALIDAFDMLDFGAAVCEPSGRIVVANATFRAMAAERDGLTDLGGVAGATHAADRAALAAAVAAGADPARAAPARMICRLSRRFGRLPLVARTVPLSRAETGAGGRGASGAAEALALLLVVDPEEAGRIDAEGIAALGRLSPAELEVCEMIVKGHQSAAIASARGTSVATTADQVKSALGKLACATRLDILRLAMATRPPGRARGYPPHGG